jgi:hypothetical protein
VLSAFLLAEDPVAGKAITAGLLLKELKMHNDIELLCMFGATACVVRAVRFWPLCGFDEGEQGE